QKKKRSRVSAGLLIFRRNNIIQVLLAHPGGPFFARKDDGVWTIPKGEAGPSEDLLTRARIEAEEELGIKPSGNWIPLGSIKQKAGRRCTPGQSKAICPSHLNCARTSSKSNGHRTQETLRSFRRSIAPNFFRKKLRGGK